MAAIRLNMRLPRNRWHACVIHLLLTGLVLIPLIAVAGYYLYPGILFATEGGRQGVMLFTTLLIPLGPGLTLLVYVPGKKGLKFDLMFLAALQLLTVAYGLHTLYVNRPLVIAYYEGSYYVIPKLRFESRGVDTSTNVLFKEATPFFVNIKLPADAHARIDVKIEHLWAGIETSVDLYEPYENALPLLSWQGISVSEAKTAGIQVSADISGEKIRIFKLVTRYNVYALAVNTDTGRPVKVLSVIESWDTPE